MNHMLSRNCKNHYNCLAALVSISMQMFILGAERNILTRGGRQVSPTSRHFCRLLWCWAEIFAAQQQLVSTQAGDVRRKILAKCVCVYVSACVFCGRVGKCEFGLLKRTVARRDAGWIAGWLDFAFCAAAEAKYDICYPTRTNANNIAARAAACPKFPFDKFYIRLFCACATAGAGVQSSFSGGDAHTFGL